MIHHSVLNEIRRTCRKDDFFYPYYQSHSIAEIGPTILSLFGVATDRPALPFVEVGDYSRYKKVVLLVIDGLAYNHFVRHYKSLPCLDRFATQGHIYPITSVFPSTTAAALTTLHTGLTPQEHALPEWHVYFQEFDSIIETLPFKTWEMADRDGLLKLGGTSDMLYEGTTLYNLLGEKNVRSYVFLPEDYTHTAYSDSVHNGSIKMPYRNGKQLMKNLAEMLGGNERRFCSVYWGEIDSISHKYGPGSSEHSDAICRFFTESIQLELLDAISPDQVNDVLLIMTADHGHANIKNEDIINLNKYDILEKNFLVSPLGKRILPTGSPHDVFLFIQPDKIDTVVDFLREELVGKAAVMNTQDAIKQGLFGFGKVNQRFLDRIGNVLILPYSGYHVWYEFLTIGPFTYLGIHGGLSEQEMIVPFGVVPLKAMVSI